MELQLTIPDSGTTLQVVFAEIAQIVVSAFTVIPAHG